MANENHHQTAVSSANMEPHTSHAALSTDRFTPLDSPVTIRVISYRKLNHDLDGISAKAVIDGIVQANILSDDSAKQVKEVTFESRKSKDERTDIEITVV